MEIDVSKCQFYCEKYDGCYCFNSSKEVYAVNPNEHNSCEANTNCYYKQLQQLKAELQAYKDKVKPVNFVDSDEYLKVVVENKQLKQENEALKEKLKEVQKFLERYEVGECNWDDDCYYCKATSKDGKYYCNIGNALEVIRGEK